MKGTFKITLNYLKELGACWEGQREFQKAFPNGGEYQEVLDRCAEEGRVDFAGWLLDHIGPTDDVRVYDEALNTPDKNIIFAGHIEFKLFAKARYIRSGRGIEAGGGIKAGWGIEAGRDIEAGGGIKAGLGIKAGGGIKAGEGIEAGGGYGIFAGLSIEICNWNISAVVTAKTRPENLISGFWEDRDK